MTFWVTQRSGQAGAHVRRHFVCWVSVCECLGLLGRGCYLLIPFVFILFNYYSSGSIEQCVDILLSTVRRNIIL